MKSIVSSTAYLVVLFFSANAASSNNNHLRTKPIVMSGETLEGPHECASLCIKGSPAYDDCMCDCDPYCGTTHWIPESWGDYSACKDKYCDSFFGVSNAGSYAGSYADCDCYCDPECSCNYGTCGDGPINADGTEGPPKPGCIECFGPAPVADDDDDPTSTS
jgi:hypothetical protein